MLSQAYYQLVIERLTGMNSQEATLAVGGSLLLNLCPRLAETLVVKILYMNKHSETDLDDAATTFLWCVPFRLPGFP